jgi:lysophospholipid acyltransferase (LPLAT)-like uncharacterized protein
MKKIHNIGKTDSLALAAQDFLSLSKTYLKEQFIGLLAAFLLKPLFSSYRFSITFEREQDRKLFFDLNQGIYAGHVGVIYACFHQQFFNLQTYFNYKKVLLLVSRSRDGELIHAAGEFLGLTLVRGSSKKMGKEALLVMKEYLQQHRDWSACFSVDGPKGPIFQAKPGAVILSQETGKPIAPMWSKPDRYWQFMKSWDQMMIPKPFAKINIYIGAIDFYTLEQLQAKLIEMQS